MVKDKEDKKEKEEEVKTIKIIIDGEEFECKHRIFSSGNVGYGLYGRVNIKGDSHIISLNLIKR